MKALHTQEVNIHPFSMVGICSATDSFARPLGNAPTRLVVGLLLEEHKHRYQDDTIVHHRPSTSASVASAWGSQKVISMA
jgi:hypothetical protein